MEIKYKHTHNKRMPVDTEIAKHYRKIYSRGSFEGHIITLCKIS